MTVTTLTSREFNQNTGQAKKAASKGPIFITDRGKPAHVLLSMADYQRLIGKRENLIDRLGQPAGVEDIEIEFPRSRESMEPRSLRSP